LNVSGPGTLSVSAASTTNTQILLAVTSHGGPSWDSQGTTNGGNQPTSWDASSLVFRRRSVGWARGQLPTSSAMSSGLLFHATHDGGTTWLSAGPAIQTTRPGDIFAAEARTLSFIDANTWFVLTDQLQVTYNGGATWSPVAVQTPLDNVTLMDFTSPNDGWAYSDTRTCSDKTVCSRTSRLLKTSDAGL